MPALGGIGTYARALKQILTSEPLECYRHSDPESEKFPAIFAAELEGLPKLSSLSEQALDFKKKQPPISGDHPGASA